MRALRRIIVLNRLPIAVLLIISGILITWQVNHGIWVSWIFFLIAILMVVAHFMIGPITLIQKHVEDGDFEGAQLLLAKVKYPNLLYKPVRSAFFMLKSNFSTIGENFEDAEAEIRKSLAVGISDKGVEGGAYLLNSIIDIGIWDELIVIQNPNIYFNTGIKAPLIELKSSFEKIGDDNLFHIFN